MKNLILSLLPIMLLAGCSDDSDLAPAYITVETIESIDPDLFEKTVILYEDDEYLITTYFDAFIATYPFNVLDNYEEMEQNAIEDAQTLDTLLMEDYMKYPNDDTYTLAHHLEKGTCLIYDKQSKKIIKEVGLEYYNNGGPMTTTAGRKFYIEKRLFLETVDLIS